MTFEQEIARRRTFGIISHPDAGKTTLTEKLLYFGGAIRVAGEVKARKTKRYVTSDFMEIEKQRGISVATSVMGFEYSGCKINILDTPGHQDFCEDTYRTLTAVDSVIMVIDHAKGVEAQTEKLLEVCRMRKTPVITFINKLDRDGLDPFDLIDEIEQKLGIKIAPLTWPLGMGKEFKGVYNIFSSNINMFSAHGGKEGIVGISDLSSGELEAAVGETAAAKLREDLELLHVYAPYSKETYLSGETTPVFFGSALNNFGVKELLDTFIEIAPPPRPRSTDRREIVPAEPKFTGFVFKIHANMDPNHRDRIAFVRICSGTFRRNTLYYHTRSEKKLKITNPTAFMAQEKEIIDEAFPGDIVGVHDTGQFKIGDTLTEGEAGFYLGIPSFSPEIFRQVISTDPLRSKQLNKGIEQLMDEGVAQKFYISVSNRTIIGTVGALQYEVMKYRLENEYGATCRFEPVPLHKAVWLESPEREELDRFVSKNADRVAQDKDGKLVYLAETAWHIRRAEETFPKIIFHRTSEY